MANADDRDKLLGLSKLRKGKGRLALDALGHFGIAFGAALLVAAPARFLRWGPKRCAWVGACVGFLAMLIREVVQFAVSGSLHLYDRLLDLLPAAPGGALAGFLCWLAVWLWRRWRSRP